MATSGAQGASRRTNGAVPVSAQTTTADTPKSNKSRTPVEGDKVVIRRLPPGLTEQELWSKLGDEWKAGQGLVNWHNFEPGKISQDPAKPSRPARVYLHVLKRENLATLQNLVQAKSWEDAKMTSNSASLVGPPAVEFAIYNKIPSGKKRTDPRQGTIDQDPEFMSFLLSLTNPEQDKETEGGDSKDAEEQKSDSKVTTTPLIEFLKEKRANKAKDAAAAKSAKQARQESQNSKGKASGSAAEESKKSKKDSKADKSADKPKETVKILTKKATAEASKVAEAVASQIIQSSAAAQEAPKSRRAGIAAAARILQRDLGISPGSAHRRARLDAAKAEAEAKVAPAKEVTPPAPEAAAASTPAAAPAQSSSNGKETSDRNASSTTTSKSGRSRRGGGGKNSTASEAKGKNTEASGSSTTQAPAKTPVVLLKKKDEEKNKDKAEKADKSEKADKEASGSASQSAPAKSNPPTGPKGSGKGSNNSKKGGGGGSTTVTPDATRGFVKHANPSQGVTETVLKQAMEAFGTVTFVEIDKRKGFAYVDFSTHDGLIKAVAASPITVAQGTVQVLERKEKQAAANAKASNANANTAGGGSSSNAATAASASGSSKENKISGNSNTNISEKPEQQQQQQHHKRTRRGRGGGKAAAANASSGGKDTQNAAAPTAEKSAGAG